LREKSSTNRLRGGVGLKVSLARVSGDHRPANLPAYHTLGSMRRDDAWQGCKGEADTLASSCHELRGRAVSTTVPVKVRELAEML